MADEAAVVEEGIGPAQSPLVTITFQRDIHRKEKYLEAEPKALGITQIGLSVYMIVCLSVFMSNDLSFHVGADIPVLISSLLVVIAGSTAVAAQNLHLPTLWACLGMQIVACVASIISIICSIARMEYTAYFCWRHYDTNVTYLGEICDRIEAALFAISVTLCAYCFKVVSCCGPPPKMPVITVQAPLAQE